MLRTVFKTENAVRTEKGTTTDVTSQREQIAKENESKELVINQETFRKSEQDRLDLKKAKRSHKKASSLK